MELFDLQAWIAANPSLAAGAAALILLLIYLLARLIFGRGLTYVAALTKNKYDDIIVKKLRPFRASLLAPFIVAYAFAYLAPGAETIIQKTALFFILWISVLTINGLINAFNQVYESSRSFTGVSIQGYLDIAKIMILLVGVILSISLVTGELPAVAAERPGRADRRPDARLPGHDHGLVASIQISTNDLVKEGDWLEVPSYDADGMVTNISLHTIKIHNWDKTITVIPTHKLVETAYKNWRGMQESGGRRIMRSIRLDQNTVRFCTPEMIERYAKIDLIADYISKRRSLADKYKDRHEATRFAPRRSAGHQRGDLPRLHRSLPEEPPRHPHQKMDFLVRELAPTSTGLPVEMYVFTKTTKWNEYERIQAEIVDHFLAAAAFFDLRLFQEPAGSDFAAAFSRSNPTTVET